ncbi:flavin reductase family protein [Streptomyces sp.]|uniref:flavin reductase family protein n=1 Tax=Streptomyces sp. TaxID=1931 RepID=UPI002D769D36|nr:flavin reductase family protein [Streptomyces sp.]HET6357779.1 flavin reductase family protein [Streptomyces sp.]
MRQVTAGAPPGKPDAPVPLATPEVSGTACRDFYARLASGVTVVTVQSPEGPAGSTASAVTSISADPPLLVVCMGTGSRTLAVIKTQGRFAVNLLGQSQRARAEIFADPGVGSAERFAGVDHRRVLAVPVLEDTLGWSVCLTEDIRRYGDHCLVVGRIAAAHTAAGQPLLWHDRSFHTLADGGVALTAAPDHRSLQETP